MTSQWTLNRLFNCNPYLHNKVPLILFSFTAEFCMLITHRSFAVAVGLHIIVLCWCSWFLVSIFFLWRKICNQSLLFSYSLSNLLTKEKQCPFLLEEIYWLAHSSNLSLWVNILERKHEGSKQEKSFEKQMKLGPCVQLRSRILVFSPWVWHHAFLCCFHYPGDNGLEDARGGFVPGIWGTNAV